MTRRVLAGGVLAIFLLSSAAAQVPEHIFRDFLDQLLRQIPMPRIPRQAMPPTIGTPSSQPSLPPVPVPTKSTTEPTLDCTKARSPLPDLICSEDGTRERTGTSKSRIGPAISRWMKKLD